MSHSGLTSRKFASFAAAICLAAFTSSPAAAQRMGAPPQTVSLFLNNPSELLTKHPTGGVEMIVSVRDLVTADPATLQPIINQIANANKDQKIAIGTALAQAAKIVVRTNPAFATEIQQAILDYKDQEVMLAFAAGSGDRPIGAGGGGGGGVGGQTNPLTFGGSGGGLQNIGQNGTATPFFSYTSGVAGLGAIAGNNTGTATTIISAPVSP